MNEREYDKLKKQIEDERQHSLEALDRVWFLATGTPPPKNRQPRKATLPVEDAAQDGRGLIVEAVKKVVESLGEGFKTSDVEMRVKEQLDTSEASRSTISHTLKRMEKAGKLEIVTMGRGRRATVYRKLPATNGAAAGSSGSVELSSGNQPCTQEVQVEIRLRLKETGFDVAELKKLVLVEKYGAHRLAELMQADADDLLRILRAEHRASESIEEYFQIH